MARRSPKLDCRLAMTRACAQTTGPRIRINRHDGASARCSVSNRPDQRSVFCPFTPPCTTHSTSSAISSLAARFASSETKRSGRGEPPPQPEHELSFPIFVRPNSVRVTGPTQPNPSSRPTSNQGTPIIAINPGPFRTPPPRKGTWRSPRVALSRQISIGDFRRRIRPSALVIREQKQWSSSRPVREQAV
jgi:hypothetical protein